MDERFSEPALIRVLQLQLNQEIASK